MIDCLRMVLEGTPQETTPGCGVCLPRHFLTYGRLGISDGWSGFWGRLFRTKSVMGRLWDDHFRHLGHPPKFYRVQDASSGNNSPFWYNFRVILMKNHSKIINLHVFSKKWLSEKKKRPLPGCLQTVVRSGDAPKPPFPIKTNEQMINPKIRISPTIPIPESENLTLYQRDPN